MSLDTNKYDRVFSTRKGASPEFLMWGKAAKIVVEENDLACDSGYCDI